MFVPAGASAGSHSVVAQCYLSPGIPSGVSTAPASSGTAPASSGTAGPSPSTVATAQFVVEGQQNPGLQLTPGSGRPGSQITVAGTGFACANSARGGGEVAVGWDGTELSPATPDSSGAFTSRIIVPKDASAGDHQVHAVCRFRTGIYAETAFTVPSPTAVGPAVTVGHSTGSPGDMVRVSGTGFACPGGPVEVAWDGTRIAETTADTSGGFSTQVPVPTGTSLGGHRLAASCGSNPATAANTGFTVRSHNGGGPGLLITALLLAAAVVAGILVRRRVSHRGRTRVGAVLRPADGPAWAEVRETDPAAGHTTTVRLEAHDDPGVQSVEEVHDDHGHA